jgi:hypothetical protein
MNESPQGIAARIARNIKGGILAWAGQEGYVMSLPPEFETFLSANITKAIEQRDAERDKPIDELKEMFSRRKLSWEDGCSVASIVEHLLDLGAQQQKEHAALLTECLEALEPFAIFGSSAMSTSKRKDPDGNIVLGWPNDYPMVLSSCGSSLRIGATRKARDLLADPRVKAFIRDKRNV